MSGERARVQVQRLLDVAEQAIRVDDWDAVLRSARAALRLDPWNADALTYYAAAARSVGLQDDRPENHPPRPIEEEPKPGPTPTEEELTEDRGRPERPTTIDYAALTERARRQRPRKRRPALWVAAAAAGAFGVAVLASAYLIGETSTSPGSPAAVENPSEAVLGAVATPAATTWTSVPSVEETTRRAPANAEATPNATETAPVIEDDGDPLAPPADGLPASRAEAVTPPVETDEYEVQASDSLLAIAGKVGATVPELLELNDLDEGALIFPGDILLVPAAGGSSAE